ncbi:MAG: hypothetical protein ACFFEF_12345 [Candidatus Thorarchaeota archaeon]
MPALNASIMEPLVISSILVVITLLISFLVFLTNASILMLATAASYLLFEFGVMLILGACLMSRQPLDDKKRYDEEGKPVSSWKWTLRGKKILFSSLFVLLFAILFSILEGLI